MVLQDGTVRQHDLRTPHTCGQSGSCPAPLIDVGHSLLAMSISSLTPHELVVAGEEHHVSRLEIAVNCGDVVSCLSPGVPI